MPKDKILVVEDDVTIRAILNHELQKVFSITLAENGEEGLKKAHEEHPDLIISDVMMPKMDGFELKEKIKNEPELHLVPFIFLTSKSGEEDRLQGLMTGADDYVLKPFNVELLLKRVRMLLDRSRVYREDSLALFSNEINSSFVPEELPDWDGFDLFCKIEPAKMGGGDYIDIIKIDDNNYMVLQGDVMGKGVKAKFFAYAFTGYFRGIIHAALLAKNSLSPAELVGYFSKMVESDPYLQQIFITFFIFSLNVKTSILKYCNAGYMPGMLFNRKTEKFKELDAGGGIPGFFMGKYEEETIHLQSDDLLFLYSDGVNEAKNVDGVMLGDDKIRKHIRTFQKISAQAIGESIYSLVQSHAKNALQYDDISISIIRKI